MTEFDDAELDRIDELFVTLDSCGNPDYGQNPHRRMPGVQSLTISVTSLREASSACRRFIDDNALGSGNWTGGKVSRGTSREAIAQISYNGRVWRPEPPVVETPVAEMPTGRGIVTIYATRTGIEAMRIMETYSKARNEHRYAWIGSYGAGSGHSYSKMLEIVNNHKQTKRGMRLTQGREFCELNPCQDPTFDANDDPHP